MDCMEHLWVQAAWYDNYQNAHLPDLDPQQHPSLLLHAKEYLQLHTLPCQVNES